MKIGKIKISDEWETDSWRNYNSLYKICSHLDHTENFYNNRSRWSFIDIGIKDGYWTITFTDLLKKEYEIMFGSSTNYKFTSSQEAKDHVDNFLFKLNNLIAFI